MSEPAHVRLLSEHVINKIAAGEVVERPASVLKELIENAFDAGATQLDVEIVGGGRQLVALADNGSGMSRDDALLALERHATSKIADVDDIEKITSLGFRGEALAAIAAVSRLRLTTCRAGETVGTELLVSGGKLQDVREAGCPAGTRLEVRDLFFNVPARRKFLRSQQTELAHARAVFLVHALARPEIGMSFQVDGKEAYRLPVRDSLENRIRELFGSDRIPLLRRVDHRGGDVSVSGYVSVPSSNRADRNEQFVFVNNRATSAPVIAYGIREGYHALAPAGRFPAVFLFLEVDPLQVDVNVHPTKSEVRFRRPSDIRDALIAAIRQALAPAGASPAPRLETGATPPPPPAPRATEQAQIDIEDLPPRKAFMYPRLTPMDALTGAAHPPAVSPPAPPPNFNPQSKIENPPPPTASPWAWCRVLGQVGGLYVILETEDGMVIMDPHAAHERVLFERFMKAAVEGATPSQSLLIPETVELQPRDAVRVRQNLALLKEMGFGIFEFGGDTFVVDALPSYFAAASPRLLLAEIAGGLEQAGSRGAKGRWREESIAQAACKAAIKARDRLTIEEVERLVVDLSRAEMPYTCPHGRPTLIYMSFSEMNRKFGRE